MIDPDRPAEGLKGRTPMIQMSSSVFHSSDALAHEAAGVLETFAATMLKDIEGLRTQLENVDLTIEQVRLLQGRVREARRLHEEYVRQFGARSTWTPRG